MITKLYGELLEHARRAFGSEVEAQEFMITPHPELDDRSPAELAETVGGAARVTTILNALEHGLAL